MSNPLVKEGDRLELDDMPDDPNPIERGARGTVTFVNELPAVFSGSRGAHAQIGVRWDNGRTLMLISDRDRYHVLTD